MNNIRGKGKKKFIIAQIWKKTIKTMPIGNDFCIFAAVFME
jgi:hypothetical protein